MAYWENQGERDRQMRQRPVDPLNPGSTKDEQGVQKLRENLAKIYAPTGSVQSQLRKLLQK